MVVKLLVHQVNTNKSIPCVETALELAAKAGADVVLVQEPWLNRQKTPKAYPLYYCAFPTTPSPRLMVATYVKKTAPSNVIRSDNPYVIVVEVLGVTLINAYRPSDEYPVFMGLLESVVPRPNPPRTLLAGDFNCHHEDWEEKPVWLSSA